GILSCRPWGLFCCPLADVAENDKVSAIVSAPKAAIHLFIRLFFILFYSSISYSSIDVLCRAQWKRFHTRRFEFAGKEVLFDHPRPTALRFAKIALLECAVVNPARLSRQRKRGANLDRRIQ